MTIDGSSHVMDYDKFLTHSGNASGGGFLANWKEDGAIDVWLHPKGGVAARWAHAWFTIEKRRNKEGAEEDKIVMNRFICHEREAILRKQRFRNDDGTREYPPVVCPYCIALERVRDYIRAGQIAWTAKLFVWELSGLFTDKNEILAGGWTGLFQQRKTDLSDAQLAEMRRAGVEQNEAYKQNGGARLDYLMRVVSVSDPSAGCVIAPCADALGKAVQKAIRDRVVATKGKYNPNRDPLCLRWLYDENKEFSAKYDIVALTEEVPDDETQEALDNDPPSLTEQLALGNIQLLRAQMEEHCLFELPWDEIFGPAIRAATAGPKPAPAAQPTKAALPAPAAPRGPVVADVAAPLPPAVAAVPPPARAAIPAPAPPPAAVQAAPAEEPIGCDVCQQPMDPNDLDNCKHCGAVYDSYTGALKVDPRQAAKAPAPAVVAPAVPPAASAGPAPKAVASGGPVAARRPRRQEAREAAQK